MTSLKSLLGELINVHRKTEDGPLESERNFRTIAEGSPVPLLVTRHSDDIILYTNPRARQMLGLPTEELDGRSIGEFFRRPDERDKSGAQPEADVSIAEEALEMRHADGRRIMTMHSLQAINYAGEDAILRSFRDITARKQLEARFFGILDIAPDAIITIEEGGNILMFNQGAQNTFGYEEDEVLGQSVEILMPERFREGHARSMAAFGTCGVLSRLMSERNGIYGLHKDGSEFPAEASVSRFDLGEGGLFNVILRDVSERKKLEAQIRRSQKLEAVGQLTGGIAHDFNNILCIIMGSLQLLQLRVKDDPDLSKYLERALEGTRRGAGITRKLLGFAGQEPVSIKELTAVNELVLQMRELVATSLTPSINVETLLADDLWPVEVDPGDLEDAILNLSLNARDAMPQGGALIIESANKVLDENYVKTNPSATTGDFVMISVSDTGAGMTDEVMENLFEPFFTTKGPGRGTGLGLSMVYAFVQRSKGFIKVYSEPGEGTTFYLFFPKARESTADATTSDDIAEQEFPRGTETVLIVDDEELLIDLAVTHLEDLSYRTFTASNGEQALEILEANQDINLLFSDIILPGEIDGYHLALSAMKVRPGLKVLLTSGFTAKRESLINEEDEAVSGLAANLLSKPYTLFELATAIRRTLDESD